MKMGSNFIIQSFRCEQFFQRLVAVQGNLDAPTLSSMASIRSFYHSKTSLRGLKQCRSMHSADCGTDHALVRCKLQITLKKFHQTRPKPLPLVDVSSTHHSLRNQRFQQLLSSKLDSTTLIQTPPGV